jgi:hypothetical protein
MSGDERGCFGSAQCAHKYVKCPRVGAKSRPTHIYRRTPSNRAVSNSLGVFSGATNASVAKPTDATAASVAPQRGHMSRRATSPTVEFPVLDASVAAESSVCRSDRRDTETTAPRSSDRRVRCVVNRCDAASDAHAHLHALLTPPRTDADASVCRVNVRASDAPLQSRAT